MFFVPDCGMIDPSRREDGRMKRKRACIAAGLYALSAIVMTVVFLTHWHHDGEMMFSTALFGAAALCFWVSAVLGAVRIKRLSREEQSSAKEEN